MRLEAGLARPPLPDLHPESKQIGEFFDRSLQVLNNSAKRFSFQFAFVHRDRDSCLIGLADVNGMATTLATEHEPELFAARTTSFAEAAGCLGVTQESRLVL